MARPRRESAHGDGITELSSHQQTFATKSVHKATLRYVTVMSVYSPEADIASIEGRVAELKDSPNGSSQPVEILRPMLIKFECPCRGRLRGSSMN
jgi:hypothetical protein